MSDFQFDSALVRTPSASVVHGLRADGGPDPSVSGIRREHAEYVAALETAGLAVATLPALEDFPDAVFVEDPALVFTNGAILLRPGAPSRAGEARAIEPELRARFDTILALEEGHVDGGDVLVMPGKVLVGLSARTDPTGAAALVDLLARLGRKCHVVRTPPGVLHLKSASSMLDHETILATGALAASGIFDGLRILAVPDGEEGAANALRLNDTLLASNSFPRTLDLLDRHEFKVHALPTTEVGKLDAGLSCMSLRWFAGHNQAAPGRQREDTLPHVELPV